jgi:hypothetical protein
MKAKRKIIYDEALMKALNFTLEDVEHNRRGRVSMAQLRYVEAKEKQAQNILYPTVMLVLIGVALFVGWQQNLASDQVVQAITLMVSLGLIVAWLNGVVGFPLPSVSMVEGAVRLISQPGNSSRFMMSLCGYTFELSYKAYVAFEENTHYRIYFEPKTHTILSVETIVEV